MNQINHFNFSGRLGKIYGSSHEFRFFKKCIFLMKQISTMKKRIVFLESFFEYLHFAFSSSFQTPKNRFKNNLPGKLRFVRSVVPILRPDLKAYGFHQSRYWSSVPWETTTWRPSIKISIEKSLDTEEHFSIKYFGLNSVHVKVEGKNLIKTKGSIHFPLNSNLLSL